MTGVQTCALPIWFFSSAVVRITPDEKNPLAPYQWCLRAYGFVGASFPGRTETVQGYTLEPGKPLRLAFTVTLTDLE